MALVLIGMLYYISIIDHTNLLCNHIQKKEIAYRWGLEYTDCTSCWEVIPPPEKGCPKYDTQLHLRVRHQFLEFWGSHSFIAIASRSILNWNGCIF